MEIRSSDATTIGYHHNNVNRAVVEAYKEKALKAQIFFLQISRDERKKNLKSMY